MEITFLGTGTSHGVPVIGCKCATCTSDDPKNQRYRSSIYIKLSNLELIIDTSPELRLQLLRNDISNIDAVLFTHAHADHLMGFDDLRGINRLKKNKISCYGNADTLKEIKRVFSYVFNPGQIGGGLPEVLLYVVSNSFKINGNQITPIPLKHGKLNTLGYRIRNMAYLTDCSELPNSSLNLLKGVEVLIIDALRYRPHPTHMNIAEALEVVNKLNIKEAYLTHLSHDVEYYQSNRELPANVQLAYDGLNLRI